MRRSLILIQFWLTTNAARIIVSDEPDDQKPVIVYDGSPHTSAEKARPSPPSANLNDLIDAEGSDDDGDDDTELAGEVFPGDSSTSAEFETAPLPTSGLSEDGPTFSSTTDTTLKIQTVSATRASQFVTTERGTTSPSTRSYVNYTALEFSTSDPTASYSTELPPDSQQRALGSDSVTGMHTESSTEAPRATFETNDPTTTIRSESYTPSLESTAQTSAGPSGSSTRSTPATLRETTGTTMKTYATVSKPTTKAASETTLNPDEIIVYLPSNRSDQAVDSSNRNQGRRVAPSRTAVVLHCVPAYVVSRRQYDGYLERTAQAAGLKKKTFNKIRKTFRKFAKDRASLRSGPSRVQETDRLQTYQIIKRRALLQCEYSERSNVAEFFRKLEENHNNSVETINSNVEKAPLPLSSSTHERLMEFLKSRRALTVDGTVVNRKEWPQVKREAFQKIIPVNETVAAEVFFKKLEFRRLNYRQLICRAATGKFATQTSKQRLHNGLLQLYRRTNLPSANFEMFMRLCEARAPTYQSIVEEDIDVVNRTIKLADVYAKIKHLTWRHAPSNERNALLHFFADVEQYTLTTYGPWLLDNAQNAASLKWALHRNAFDLAELASFKFNSSEQTQLNRLLLKESALIKKTRSPVSSKELENEMLTYNSYWNRVASGISRIFSYRSEITLFVEKLGRLVFFRNNYKHFLS